MTFAASRTVAVVATATGSRPTRSRTRVLRMALPRRRQLQRRDRPAHPARALGVEEGVDLGVVGAQPMEVLGGQEQGQAVLDGGDVEGRRVALGEAGRAEAGPLATAVDQAALGVAHLRRAGAQHDEVVVVAAALDERGAPAEVRRGSSAPGGRRAPRPAARRRARGARGSRAPRTARRRGPCRHRRSGGDAVTVAPVRWRARRAASLDERAPAPVAKPPRGR